MWFTADGGATWSTMQVRCGPVGALSATLGTSQVIFVSRRHGFVLGDDSRNSETATIWRTIDGGTRSPGTVPRP
jgi:photosystem II stability/assembly factor-like uncharacterized protein